MLQSSDLQHLGEFQQPSNLALHYLYLAAVHKVHEGLEVVGLDVVQDDHRMWMIVGHQQLPEEGTRIGQYHFVTFEHRTVLAHQRQVDKLLFLVTSIEREHHVRGEALPLEAQHTFLLHRGGSMSILLLRVLRKRRT